MPLEGSHIGRFRLLRLHARGGMGEVYLAEDDQLRRQVAIKVIQAEYPDPDATRLFLREARAIAMLNHPHILPLFDFGEATIYGTTLTYMVMPFYKDDTLAAWMQQRKKAALPSPQDVGFIVQQAASALQYAHNHQIVHQDVKPSNFLIRGSEEASGGPDLLLADFGVAKSTSTTASVSQSVRGTPAYMAPEQWEGTPVPATDQYALAIMAYDLLTGHPPFQGSLGQVMYQHIHVTPQPPGTLNPRVPTDVDAVILHALAKKPEERFASISAFARAFQQALPVDSSSPTLANTLQEPDSSDIHATLVISEVEALTGTTRILTLLGGRQVPVTIPAGTQDGQIIHLKGQGEPASDRDPTGALILTVTIAPPEEQARQAEAEQLRRAKEEHSRQAEERPVREAEPDGASPQVTPPSLGTTEAATVLLGRPIQQYLFALLVGALAGIFSVLLTSVLFSVNHSNYVLLPLPPLVMSLITGFITGKRVVVPTAGLFAGLVVGVSWSVYILSVRVNNPIMYPKEWVTESVTVVACAATCGLLSWLVAWLSIRTTEAATVLPGRPRERHLFTLLVGALAGIFSVLLTGVLYSVLYTVNYNGDGRVGFALLPPLVMSLITGFIIGKRVVVPTAGLFAGLVVGVSWFIYVLYMLLAHDAGFTPFYQQEWVAIFACAATCGPLSWLVAWLTTRKHPYYLSSGSRNQGR